MIQKLVLCVAVITIISDSANGLIKRCYSCRSRGELGSCKDPFRYNASHVDPQPGLTTVPCASGWCGKVIEGETGAFREDDFDTATQRMCVQRGPDDSEDRCANTVYNYKKVYMCFCQGDLCNASPVIHRDTNKILVASSFALVAFKKFLIKIR